MRNWNAVVAISWPLIIRFLQYLWGIETEAGPELLELPQGFYSTYEELKPTPCTRFTVYSEVFLQYLWGIETGLAKN